jgi:putative OPT family oligopeptide transporter
MRGVLRADEAEAAPMQVEAASLQPHVPPRALTPRALVLGSLIGAVMCLSNLYVGLKTGFGFPVALLACVVGLGTWRTLARLLRASPGFSLLETSAMQSTASSAGYSTGGTIISASVAWLMLAGQHPPGWTLFLWTLLVSALGVCFAVPLQRAFLRREPLTFPAGVAAATAARALHSGDETGRQGARALGLGTLAAAGMTLARVRGMPLASLPFSLELGLLGAGALVGLRIGGSLLLGVLVCSEFLIPWLHTRAANADPALTDGLNWSMWPGTALMTSASLTHLLLHRGALRRSFSALFGGGAGAELESPEREVPRRWLLMGIVLLSAATVALGAHTFGIPAHLGLLGVLLSFVLAVVGCRVTGETDISAVGPLGQVAQLAFGALMPGNTLANTAAASLAGSTGASSADLLTDVKAGSLLGALPRQTFLAQLWGCVVGSAVIVPAFLLLVPDTSVLTPERFPAPGGLFVVSTARVVASGLGALPEAARWAALVGAAAGVAFALLEQRAPEPLRRFMPSSIALGLAFMLPVSSCVYMFLGSLAAALLTRFRPAFALAATVPLAAGLITGESLVSLILTLLAAS